MAKINVHTPFTLAKDDGSRQAFAIGEHEVDDALKDHWYVKLHTGKKLEPQTSPPQQDGVTAAELEARAASLAALEKQLAEREAELEAHAATLDDREQLLEQRETELAARAAQIAASSKPAAPTAQADATKKSAK